MFDVGGGELILILLAILILFGPKKIPEAVQMFAKGVRKFKQAQAQFQSEFNEVTKDVRAPVEKVKEQVQREINSTAKSFDVSKEINLDQKTAPKTQDIPKPTMKAEESENTDEPIDTIESQKTDESNASNEEVSTSKKDKK